MVPGDDDARDGRRPSRRIGIAVAIGVAALVGVGVFLLIGRGDEPPAGSLVYVYASPPDGRQRIAESTSVFRARGTWELRFNTASSGGSCDSTYRVVEQRSDGPPTRIDEIRGQSAGTGSYDESGTFVVTVEYACATGAVGTTSIQVVQR